MKEEKEMNNGLETEKINHLLLCAKPKNLKMRSICIPYIIEISL